MRACPFCHEADFDAVGLKVHLSSGHCEAYESTPSPARTVRLGSPHPAATAREEGDPCPPVLDEGYIGWKEAPLAMKGALANANEWLWWFIRRDNPGASGSLRDYLAALALARSAQ